MQNDLRIEEQEFTEQELSAMREYIKRYDSIADKKEFLRQLNPYEQKQILLNSQRPYNELVYLLEIDSKQTNIVLSSLGYDEIKEILEKFSLEDKNTFYARFSNLDLVNKFIKYDAEAELYIKNLPSNRKIDLIQSVDLDTRDATSKIIGTIPDSEMVTIVQGITTAEGKASLNDSGVDIETLVEASNDGLDKGTDEQQFKQAEQDEEQGKLEQQQIEPELQQLDENLIKSFFAENIDYFIANIKGFESFDASLDLYESLSEELRNIVMQEFISKSKKEEELETKTKLEESIEGIPQDHLLGDFQSLKQETELEELGIIQANLGVELKEEISKTL